MFESDKIISHVCKRRYECLFCLSSLFLSPRWRVTFTHFKCVCLQQHLRVSENMDVIITLQSLHPKVNFVTHEFILIQFKSKESQNVQ